jgi:hypothetical protein
MTNEGPLQNDRIGVTMLKKFGALPFIAIALLAGAFFMGQKMRWPSKPGLLGSLLPSRNKTEAEAPEASTPPPPSPVSGECPSCGTTQLIWGGDLSDAIKCRGCHRPMTIGTAIANFHRHYGTGL